MKESLWLRGTLPQADGSKRRQRVSLKLKATEAELNRAELRALQLYEVITSGAYPSCGLPWERETRKSEGLRVSTPSTVAAWAESLATKFWAGRVRSTAAERTWERLSAELKRLPQGAELTVDLLVGVAAQTEPGSRTRLESCKVFKRLARHAGLQGFEQLDALRTPYEPQPRELPTDEELLTLVGELRGDAKWGWATAALMAYGCRPSEVFSLRPGANGTAQVLTVKRKGRQPAWRTALCLPAEMFEDFELGNVNRPREFLTPAAYDSAEAKRMTDSWGGWLGRQVRGRLEGLQLYDLRHCWAVRSIRENLNASLAAKCMGHDLAVHSRTYHRWLEQADVEAVAATLRNRA
jgi:integrase